MFAAAPCPHLPISAQSKRMVFAERSVDDSCAGERFARLHWDALPHMSSLPEQVLA
eukprot:CAMPEP_0183355530 /NCGR_PEP_ID=MMETSP0164_2-20130417/40777_1 /TAXON_ID=221442 /ORGANISM="Coccolithus pelagicus ssp braarudi, Strain PLY182g" /LENGTH=55 /DNA_ID=CAMNT_0025528665 /DNA_START=448 /DNA_END=615 /DNA_ORIENTATION=+